MLRLRVRFNPFPGMVNDYDAHVSVPLEFTHLEEGIWTSEFFKVHMIMMERMCAQTMTQFKSLVPKSNLSTDHRGLSNSTKWNEICRNNGYPPLPSPTTHQLRSAFINTGEYNNSFINTLLLFSVPEHTKNELYIYNPYIYDTYFWNKTGSITFNWLNQRSIQDLTSS